MSSIKFDRETGTEDVRKMTMQWDYGFAPSVKLRERKQIPFRPFQYGLPNAIKSLVEVVFTLLGAATTVAAVVFLMKWIQSS